MHTWVIYWWLPHDQSSSDHSSEFDPIAELLVFAELQAIVAPIAALAFLAPVSCESDSMRVPKPNRTRFSDASGPTVNFVQTEPVLFIASSYSSHQFRFTTLEPPRRLLARPESVVFWNLLLFRAMRTVTLNMAKYSYLSSWFFQHVYWCQPRASISPCSEFPWCSSLVPSTSINNNNIFGFKRSET